MKLKNSTILFVLVVVWFIELQATYGGFFSWSWTFTSPNQMIGEGFSILLLGLALIVQTIEDKK